MCSQNFGCVKCSVCHVKHLVLTIARGRWLRRAQKCYWGSHLIIFWSYSAISSFASGSIELLSWEYRLFYHVDFFVFDLPSCTQSDNLTCPRGGQHLIQLDPLFQIGGLWSCPLLHVKTRRLDWLQGLKLLQTCSIVLQLSTSIHCLNLFLKLFGHIDFHRIGHCVRSL